MKLIKRMIQKATFIATQLIMAIQDKYPQLDNDNMNALWWRLSEVYTKLDK